MPLLSFRVRGAKVRAKHIKSGNGSEPNLPERLDLFDFPKMATRMLQPDARIFAPLTLLRTVGTIGAS
jgi:hypothetical protein